MMWSKSMFGPGARRGGSSGDDGCGSAAAAAKPPRPIDQTLIHEMAKRYLERYEANAHRVENFLAQKIARGLRAGWYAEVDPDALSAMIATTVSTAQRIGLIDDKGYAGRRAASLSRRGKSASRIALDLRSRGVDADLTQSAIAETETTDAERARFLARRKRIGPWRSVARAENRDKDIARLCRAGFSPGLAKSVIDAPLPDSDGEGAPPLSE
ncbi:regulatory protein RecX [Rhodoblastus acidophilus]|uniref:regulatory protein RecX n=1 Tax=Rhodoblastus acidophilus TaxID=1074 RepID=UPI002224E2A1|nr:RecX family transcriptional regulator [Rhodoblastus acidophilus]